MSSVVAPKTLLLLITFSVISSSITYELNIQFFTVFPNASEWDDDNISIDNINVVDEYKSLSKPQSLRITFTATEQDVSPRGIIKLFTAISQNGLANRSPFANRRFVIAIGTGPAIQQSVIAIRSALSGCKNCPFSVFAYDTSFFNHANITGSVFQLNQDRKTIMAPILASTVLHESNPKGGLVVLIHDLRLASDQVYIATHSLFNTLVLVTDDQSEDVVALNFRNDIIPILKSILLSKTIPAATFVVHVANSKTLAKIFSAANQNNLLSVKYVWIVTDRSVIISKHLGKLQLKPPLNLFILPKRMIALETNRKKLFEMALTRLMDGLVKTITRALKRIRFRKPKLRRKSPGFIFSHNVVDLSFSHLFEKDGSVLQNPFAEESECIRAVYIKIESNGTLALNRLVDDTILTLTSHSMGSTSTVAVKEDKVMFMVMNGSMTTTSETPDMLISDGSGADDVFPYLIQAFISLGPPFLFEKPLSQVNNDCQGPSSVICDRIMPVAEGPYPAPAVMHRCCSGLVPDLVRTLAKDLKLNARIVVTASAGTRYLNSSRALGNSSILDLLNRRVVDMVFTADPYIGHSSRSRYYTTDPFFTSSYAMLVALRKKEPSLFSFLSPFPISVWTGIIVCLAPATALAISQFEWNSPFGLNPWGRKRSTNYTLGSALNMVFAILFGHTIKTKCPKAWPSKWTQNFWAGFAIFVVASYTGNLASFLAKRHESPEIESIYDLATPESKLRVAVIRDDPIVEWLRSADADLGEKLVLVDTLEDAVSQLQSYAVDVVIGKVATLRYWQLTVDASTCLTKLLPRTFAHRDLAPAMLVDSQFRSTVAGKMREYKMSGEFKQLINKNRLVSASLIGASTGCDMGVSGGLPGGSEWSRKPAETQLTLSHANGLFLTMIFAIVACCFILVIEHLLYYWVVPKLRSKRRKSFWRGFTLMYFSQRMYRILNSEELIRPSQVLKEMLGAIKRLEFSRIFQKSARKKRFRKITIAEFVQQMKDEKEKTLPDIVVQTKGIHKAKRAWKRGGSTATQNSSSVEEEQLPAAASIRYKRSPKRITPESKKHLLHESSNRLLLPTVQHQLAATSSASLSSLKEIAEEELKPASSLDHSKSSASVLIQKRRVGDGLDKNSRRLSKSDALETFKSSKYQGINRNTRMTSTSDLSPAMRWEWLKIQIATMQARERRITMLTVFKKEMDEIMESRARLENKVVEQNAEIEKLRQERDRLMIVQEIELSSTV